MSRIIRLSTFLNTTSPLVPNVHGWVTVRTLSIRSSPMKHQPIRGFWYSARWPAWTSQWCLNVMLNTRCPPNWYRACCCRTCSRHNFLNSAAMGAGNLKSLLYSNKICSRRADEFSACRIATWYGSLESCQSSKRSLNMRPCLLYTSPSPRD